jgi:hypothetical protein
MNTIKCRIKTNDFSDAPGVGVTPAEVILLRTVHDKHAGGCCIKLAQPSGVAMTETGVKPKIIKTTDGSGNEVEMKTTEPVLRERTDAEEIVRLRAKYQVRAKSGAAGTHICDDLFGGSGVVPILPKTFAELPERYRQGLKIEVKPVEAVSVAALDGVTEQTPSPEVIAASAAPSPTSPRDELLAKTKGELVTIATEYKVENVGKLNKAELIEAILTKAGYTDPVTAQ